MKDEDQISFFLQANKKIPKNSTAGRDPSPDPDERDDDDDEKDSKEERYNEYLA